MRLTVKSRNGHTFKRVRSKPWDYFLVDGVRYDNYYEAVNEFRKLANPKRYGKMR